MIVGPRRLDARTDRAPPGARSDPRYRPDPSAHRLVLKPAAEHVQPAGLHHQLGKLGLPTESVGRSPGARSLYGVSYLKGRWRTVTETPPRLPQRLPVSRLCR